MAGSRTCPINRVDGDVDAVPTVPNARLSAYTGQLLLIARGGLSSPCAHSRLISKYTLTVCMAPSLVLTVVMMSVGGMLNRHRSRASAGDRRSTNR